MIHTHGVTYGLQNLDNMNDKKKVAIIAPTGMLGSGVYRALFKDYQLILLARNPEKLELLYQAYGNTGSHTVHQIDLASIWEEYQAGFQQSGFSATYRKLTEILKDADTIINCAGIIKPHSLTNPALTFFINGTFPHLLANTFKDKLIHITTDCVYDGLSGAPYTETATKNPVDVYGVSKMIGEPQAGLILRTSIIGPELGTQASLLEWFRNQKSEVKGFTNHLWNGITTYQFGKICKNIIENKSAFPTNGLYHIFSTDVSKYDMLTEFQKKFNTKFNIQKIQAETAIDRRLASNHALCASLNIPSFSEMIREL